MGAGAFPIDEESVADLLRQRKARGALRRACHAEWSVGPVHIAPLERRAITSAEAQTGQEHEDGVVAHPTWGRELTGRQHLVHRLGRERLGERGEPPLGKGGEGIIQAWGTAADGDEKAQKHAHRGHDGFGAPDAALPSPLQDERAEGLRLKALGPVAQPV
jgi:hypothetical protein